MSTEDSRRTGDRHGSKQPPIANSFALGYTYHDVLDADHEGKTFNWEYEPGLQLIRFRYSCPFISIPPLRPFTFVCPLSTTPLDPSNDSEYSGGRTTRLVAAMVLVKAIEGLDTLLGNTSQVTRWGMSGEDGGNHDFMERERSRGKFSGWWRRQ